MESESEKKDGRPMELEVRRTDWRPGEIPERLLRARSRGQGRESDYGRREVRSVIGRPNELRAAVKGSVFTVRAGGQHARGVGHVERCSSLTNGHRGVLQLDSPVIIRSDTEDSATRESDICKEMKQRGREEEAMSGSTCHGLLA